MQFRVGLLGQSPIRRWERCRLQRFRRRERTQLFAIAWILAAVLFTLTSATASAATGDLVGTVAFSQQCGGFQGVGVGITFDGTNLWYSCAESTPDLFRADPHTGQVTASYTIGGGIGALAYDASHNVIYAGWGNSSNEGDIYSIQLDGGKNVTGSSVKFTAPGAVVCGLDDGLALDGSNDTLYISDDCSTTIHHYDLSGNELGSFPWAGSSCYNSGLALGDQQIFEGADGCNTVYVVDKSAPQTVQFQFSTVVPGDPNFRDEGLSCDTSSFPGKDVMWSKEAYAPERAHAFEIPSGSCGVGGQPPSTGWYELNQARTVSTSAGYGVVGGRVTSLATAPDDGSLVFAGTAGGGVWRSTDGGRTWTPLSDGEPTLAVGALALDPRDDNTLYVGTGDNWLGPGSLPGKGIRYTHDALDPHPHWDWLRNPTTGAVDFAGARIMSIVIDGNAPRQGPYPSNVLVAAENGIWQSGDGGQTWSLRIGATNTQKGSSSPLPANGWVVAPSPDQPGRFYAAASDPNYQRTCGGGVYVTNDSGVRWTQARHFNQPIDPHAGPNRTRMRIGLGVGRNGTVVAAVSDCLGFLTSQGHRGKVVYYSRDGASSWSTVDAPSAPDAENGDWFSTGHSLGQGDYDNVVALDPQDTSCCLTVFGGVSLETYDFGGGGYFAFGNQWNLASQFEPDGPVHADYHAAVFSQSGDLYVGTDGGVWSLKAQENPVPVPPPPPAPTENHWKLSGATNLNAGLDAIQFYRGDALDVNHAIGGSQDNGMVGNLTGGWSSYTPSNDGGYVSLFGNRFLWENDSTLQQGTWDLSGTSAPSVTGTLCDPTGNCPAKGDPAIFTNTPNALVSDPSRTPYALYGTNRLLGRSIETGGPLVPLSPSLKGNSPLADCVLLTLSPLLPPTDRDCFSAITADDFAGTGVVGLGTDLGEIWIHTGSISTTNVRQGWVMQAPSNNRGAIPPPTPATKVPGIPWITGLAVKFDSPDEAWVTLGTSTGPRIYHTTTASSATPNWTSLDAPSLPAGLVVTGVTLDPNNENVIYVSTSKGVFECQQCGGAQAAGSWQPVGPGLPNVWVSAVTVTQDGSALIAWTFGRGAWAIARPVNGPVKTVRVSDSGLAPVAVDCNGENACRGVAELTVACAAACGETGAAQVADIRHKRLVVLGQTRFVIAAHTHRSVEIRLSARGRELLKAQHNYLRATFTVKRGGSRPNSTPVTLLRPMRARQLGAPQERLGGSTAPCHGGQPVGACRSSR